MNNQFKIIDFARKLKNIYFKILAENSLLFKGEMKGVIYANALTKIYF